MDAINSLVKQTYCNIEIIVHDNNSSDGTIGYINKHIRDDRIRVHKVSTDLTMTDNWNRAFGYVKGKYFMRLDDDNVLANDFIERCIEEIKDNGFNIFIFAPMIMHLGDKIFTIFSESHDVYTITGLQLCYLNYFNLTDSNSALYEVSLIKKIFPDGNIYKTTLPDRHLDYCLIDKIGDIKIGMSPKIKGITRYDYRLPVPVDYELKFFDYNNLSLRDILRSIDCRNNFWMHRIATLEYFLKNCESVNLKNFFDKKIIDPIFYNTMMELGHIYMAGSAFLIRELVVYDIIILSVMIKLVMHPFGKLEGRKMPLNFMSLVRNSMLFNFKSLINIIQHKTRDRKQPNKSSGDLIVEDFIKGKNISSYVQFCQKGDLRSFLNTINNL